MELTRIESGKGLSKKPSARAVLADNSQKSFEKPLPFGSVGVRRIPRFGTESRQPDGNAPTFSLLSPRKALTVELGWWSSPF